MPSIPPTNDESLNCSESVRTNEPWNSSRSDSEATSPPRGSEKRCKTSSRPKNELPNTKCQFPSLMIWWKRSFRSRSKNFGVLLIKFDHKVWLWKKLNNELFNDFSWILEIKNGTESYLQAPSLEEAKQEVRPKPDRSIRSNPKLFMATTKGYR